MKIDTDTIVSIKIVNLLKESGMEPLDAIMCLHSSVTCVTAMMKKARMMTNEQHQNFARPTQE